MTRNELINDLVCVRSQIQKIINVTEQQVNIVANFRQTQATIETKGVKNGAMLFLAAVMVILVYLLGSWNGWMTALIFCGCIAFLYFMRYKETKLKILAVLYIAFYVFAFLELIWSSIKLGNYGVLLVLLFLIALSILGFLAIIKVKNMDTQRKNAQIRKHNSVVQVDYDKTVQQLSVLKRDLRTFGEGWYPPKYYSLDAVNFFIDALTNFEANSLSEAVKLYVQTQQFNQLMQSQKTLIQLGQQQVVNQEAMLRELKFANVLNVQNLALQFSTVSAINANTAAVNNASSRGSYDTNRILDKMNEFKR